MARVATDAMGASVFVDGEKSVEKALFLACASDRPRRLIHLTRDPRGWVVSQSEALSLLGQGDANPQDRVRLARSWQRYHMRIRLARRLLGPSNTLTIRYEDLATQTERTMQRVFEFIGVPPLVSDPSRRSRPQTHAIGNVMLKTYDGSIVPDERWRSELSEAEAADILRKSGRFAAQLGYR
jgi:hypothetical protein